uniref:Gem-associated protein 2 n=1 Tax=Rhabditophanes sp. KR3021 TaxID=114890 RepID=A0AC35UF56_9BILA
MDQPHFIALSKFDRESINIDKPAKSAEEYLKQGVLIRENAARVVRADYKSVPTQVQFQNIEQLKNNLAKCDFIPSAKWIELQIRLFLSQRVKFLEDMDSTAASMSKITFPQKPEDWVDFCLFNRHRDFHFDEDEITKTFLGYPPIPKLIASMTVSTMSKCLFSLVDYFIETESPPESLFPWFYSLFLSLPLPLHMNTADTIRKLSKECHKRRSQLAATDYPLLIKQYTLIIGIVGNCYNQKDLADYKL